MVSRDIWVHRMDLMTGLRLQVLREEEVEKEGEVIREERKIVVTVKIKTAAKNQAVHTVANAATKKSQVVVAIVVAATKKIVAKEDQREKETEEKKIVVKEVAEVRPLLHLQRDLEQTKNLTATVADNSNPLKRFCSCCF